MQPNIEHRPKLEQPMPPKKESGLLKLFRHTIEKLTRKDTNETEAKEIGRQTLNATEEQIDRDSQRTRHAIEEAVALAKGMNSTAPSLDKFNKLLAHEKSLAQKTKTDIKTSWEDIN